MKQLEAYIPSYSINMVSNWIDQLDILIKPKKDRYTKLGDFRINKHGNGIITINKDLNRYAFLITLTHEIAHAFVWQAYKYRVLPHGREWKNTYKRLILQLLNPKIFPDEILRVLSNHIKKPKASTVNDYELTSILRKYDKIKVITISEIPNCSKFSINTGRRFIKLEKIKKRYKCQEIKSGKLYTFNPLTIVNIIT